MLPAAEASYCLGGRFASVWRLSRAFRSVCKGFPCSRYMRRATPVRCAGSISEAAKRGCVARGMYLQINSGF
uniref:Uncharacterized protein n=1 Tax=Tetraselmis sp. GSL018 TaxID=582737 RepID=A0A061SNS3_9CHLO